MMDLYPEMFISKWHLIVLFFTAVAFFAMVVGKYPKKTVAISTVSAFFIIYVIVTIPIAATVYNSEKQTEYVDAGLAEIYEQHKGNPNEELIVFVGGFYDDERDFTAKVYAKNFHDEAPFDGKVRVAIFDEDGDVMEDETYDVTLEPGEKKEIDPFFDREEFAEFRFQFNPQP